VKKIQANAMMGHKPDAGRYHRHTHTAQTQTLYITGFVSGYRYCIFVYCAL